VTSASLKGLSNIEVAEQLVVAEGTVKTHTSHRFAKISVRDRAQAVACADGLN
jgi:ATP/maltotriose-dependent transcriptional regulator MalT